MMPMLVRPAFRCCETTPACGDARRSRRWPDRPSAQRRSQPGAAVSSSAVAVALVLVMNPAVLLADEPTGNLDTKSADDVFSLLRDQPRAGHQRAVGHHNPGAGLLLATRSSRSWTGASPAEPGRQAARANPRPPKDRRQCKPPGRGPEHPPGPGFSARWASRVHAGDGGAARDRVGQGRGLGGGPAVGSPGAVLRRPPTCHRARSPARAGWARQRSARAASIGAPGGGLLEEALAGTAA